MPRSITDRYIASTVCYLPKNRRSAVARQLRDRIEDAVADRASAGQVMTDAEHDVLAELGDPARTADTYTSARTSLVSPRYYVTYVRTLAWSLGIFLPVTFAFSIMGYVIREEGIGTLIFGPLGIVIQAAVYVFAIVTLAFVLLDRFTEKKAWSPEAL